MHVGYLHCHFTCNLKYVPTAELLQHMESNSINGRERMHSSEGTLESLLQCLPFSQSVATILQYVYIHMLYCGHRPSSTSDMAANFWGPVWFLSALWGQSTTCNQLEVEYLKCELFVNYNCLNCLCCSWVNTSYLDATNCYSWSCS